MLNKAWQIAAVMAAAGALVFAACGDDDEPTAAAVAGRPRLKRPKAKVGVILPDAASSARWETADRKFLGEAFEAAGRGVRHPERQR